MFEHGFRTSRPFRRSFERSWTKRDRKVTVAVCDGIRNAGARDAEYGKNTGSILLVNREQPLGEGPPSESKNAHYGGVKMECAAAAAQTGGHFDCISIKRSVSPVG